MRGCLLWVHGLLARRLAALVLAIVTLAAPAAATEIPAPAPNWGEWLLGPSSIEVSAGDADGNSYFLGQFNSATALIGSSLSVARIGGSQSLLLVKMSPTGSVIWAKAVGAAAGGITFAARGLAVDPAGNIFAIGEFTGPALDAGGTGNVTLNGFSVNGALIKFRPDGSIAWGAAVGGAGNGALRPFALALDSSHNPVVAGTNGSSGTSTVAGSALTKQGQTADVFVAKFDGATGAGIWASNYGGAASDSLGGIGVGVDGADNIYVFGQYNATVAFGLFTLPTAAVGTLNLFHAKLGPTGTPLWARSYGGSGSATTSGGAATYDTFSVDRDGNSYFIAAFSGGPLSVGSVSLTWTGSYKDILLAKIDTSGYTAWARNYGTPGAVNTVRGLAVDASGNVYVGGTFDGATLDIGGTILGNKGGNDAFLFRLNESGRVDWARSYGGSGGSETIYSIAIAGSSDVVIIGNYGPGAMTLDNVTLEAGSGRRFAVGIRQVVPRPEPPPPPPAFVSPTNPPPTAIAAHTTGAGQGTVSLASSFSNAGGLTFTVAQVSGAALPGWLTFDPATVSFNYDIPLPPDLPIQPSADPTARAGRNVANTVYPLAVLVQTVPVVLTATGGGQSYAVTINMDFYAPRAPVAISAVSYSLAGASGNAASARPAISWDGGQVVFETAATNINAAAVGPYTSIARYHGLSGLRDLLSQTAIPGGGVANAADGNSNNPAVSAAGNYAAFSSAAPAVSATVNNGLRQVYRTSLAYPRVQLNEAATPAAVMVSTTASGVAADAAADWPAMSEQGDFVAFESAATNLGANPDRFSQIWRKNMTDGTVALVSSTAAGVAGNGDSRNVSLSWDGNFAVFDSTATNLVPGGPAGRHVYLKDLSNGLVYRLSAQAGAGNPKLDARTASVVYVSSAGTTSQVMRYDIATGATTTVSVTPAGVAGNGDSNQPTVSADGRFVAFRSTATDLVAGYAGNGQAQIWVRDVMRGVTALVSQTEAGSGGNGASSDPAIAGDGASIVFTSRSTDLVNGTPRPGQIHLAGNPLVLPGRTGYWSTTDGGNLAWSVERWGDTALIAGLAYNADGGTAVWAAGFCRFTGLVCQGTVEQWSGSGTAATPVGPVTLTFDANGAEASMVLGGTASRTLALYPVGGTRTTGYAGLPQAGYWGVVGNAAGVSSLFIDTDTQVASNGSSVQAMHVTLFGYDTAGNAQWYAARGNLAADQSFTGQLYLYSGGSSWSQAAGSNAPSSIAVGTLRLNFTATDRVTALLPDGRTVAIARWRF